MTWHTFGKTAFAGWVAWQIIAAILAAPVLYAMAQTSTAMALWVGFCMVAGLALSVWLPLKIWRKVKR